MNDEGAPMRRPFISLKVPGGASMLMRIARFADGQRPQSGDAIALLILCLPGFVWHPIDYIACCGIAERQPALLGSGPIPFGQAIAAEAGQIHQVDVLHVGTLAQVLHEASEGSGLEFGTGSFIHLASPVARAAESRQCRVI